ncbi:HNH endonuclease [Planctomycetota bacterium]
MLFLEVHHLFRLADDGPDIPDNVAAICPNCHRELHYGADRD